MKKFTKEKIDQIAESMSMGVKCYYKIDTEELIDQFDYKPESEDEDFDPADPDFEIEDDNYVQLDPIPSHDSYEIMKDFARSIDDEPFKNKLFDALEKHKPFRHFKWLVEGSDKHQAAWNDFQDNAQLKYVQDEIAFQISNLKDEEE